MTASQREFLFGEIVTGCDQLLLAGLQFDLRAQGIDGRSEARFLLIGGLVVKRLSILTCASAVSMRAAVAMASRYALPTPAQPTLWHLCSCAARIQPFGGGAFLLKVAIIEDRLTYRTRAHRNS